MTRDSVMPSSSLDFNLDTVENNPFPEVDIDLRSPEEIVLDEQTRVRNILATGNNFSLDNFY